MPMMLTAPAFQNAGAIPSQYTCEGKDLSPKLEWSGAPANTKSFALIVDDPDAPDPKAPQRTWVHWVLYDIPASVTSLPEGMQHATGGARDGTNDWKRTGWGGPCPPIGRHRYFFKLYALNAMLGDKGKLTKAELEQAMAGRVVAQAELMGTYQKSR